jgi:hypothetical protein
MFHLCLGSPEFQCPYCDLDIEDKNDKLLNRINNNKKLHTRMKCACGNIIGVSYDFKGRLIGFKLTNQSNIFKSK